MADLLEEFQTRRKLLGDATPENMSPRMRGIYEWLESHTETRSIVAQLRSEADASSLVVTRGSRVSCLAGSLEEVAAVGMWALQKSAMDESAEDIANSVGIYSPGSPNGSTRELVIQYVNPALDYVERHLVDSLPSESTGVARAQVPTPPLIIHESLAAFQKDHPNPERAAFIMMSFETSPTHDAITTVIRDTLKQYGIEGLRADDKEYHDDLFPNVQTYMHGCGFGIAVFERVLFEQHNPNVALEVGYMMSAKKRVCLLKDQSLQKVQADLVGKLYRPFDTQAIEKTIPPQLESWLRDKDIIT